eukprot:GGOE01020465.1.p1 GENE.GGOE01020465.1~~GGOE01020465.1.p1  ORF type:complete len:1566 (+),score=521.73 GGOE01020465.1:67-4764(+)
MAYNSTAGNRYGAWSSPRYSPPGRRPPPLFVGSGSTFQRPSDWDQFADQTTTRVLSPADRVGQLYTQAWAHGFGGVAPAPARYQPPGQPSMSQSLRSSDYGTSEARSPLSVMLLQAIQLVESSTVQSFDPEELELLRRLNVLMNAECPRCGYSSPMHNQLRSPYTSPEAGRPMEALRSSQSSHMQNLRQLTRGVPRAPPRPQPSGPVPEMLLAIALSLLAGAQTPDALLVVLGTQLLPLLASDACSLFLLEEEQLVNVQTKSRHRVVGLVGFVAVARCAVRTEAHAPQTGKFDPSIDIPCVAAMCLPVFGLDSQVLGVLRIVRLQGMDGSFMEEDQGLAEIVASFLSSGLLFARAQQEREAAVEKNRTLLRVAAALASAEYDTDKVCIRVLDIARTLLSADRCSLFILDQAKGELEAHFDDQTTARIPLNHGIAGHVAQTGEVVNIPDAYRDSRFNRNVDLQTGYLTQSLLCIPIRFEDRTVAVAQLVNKLEAGRAVAFTQADVDNFLTFSGYAAISLRNMQLFQLAHLEHRRAESMLSMTYTLAGATLDMPELVRRVMAFAKDLTKCDRCSLYIVNEQRRALDAYHEGLPPESLPGDAGIVGRVATTRQALNLPDVEADPHFDRRVDEAMGYRTKTLLCMPIMCGPTIVAVASLLNKMVDGAVVPFTSADKDAFVSFAVYAGTCIRTAVSHLNFQQQQATANLLLDLTRTLQHHAVGHGEELQQVLMDRAKAMTGAARCAIFLINEESRHLEAPKGSLTTPNSIDWEIARYVAATDAPVTIHDRQGASRFPATGETDIQTLLCVPMRYDKAVVAVAQLVNKLDAQQQIVPFDDHDMEVLDLFSQYAALALRISRLYNKSVFEKQWSQTMLNFAQQLASTGLEEASIVALVLEQAPRLGDCETCQLILPGPQSAQEVRCFVSAARPAMPLPAGIKLIDHLLQTQEALIMDDAQADPLFDEWVASLSGCKARTVLGVPLRLRGEVLGVLLLLNKHKGKAFTIRDAELLRLFADFVSMALANCRAVETLSKQKHFFSAQASILGNFVATPIKDGVKIVENVMEGAKALLNADRCTVFAVDKEQKELVSKVAQEVGQEIRVPWNQGIAGMVVQTGKMLNIADAYEYPHFNREVDLRFGYKTKSILAAPIWHEAEVIGVAQVINKKDNGPFTEEDEKALASFAVYAGIALGNLRLYEFVVGAGQAATELLDLQEVPSTLSRRKRSVALFKKFRAVDEHVIERCTTLEVPARLLEDCKGLGFNPYVWHKDKPLESDDNLTLIRLLAHLFDDLGLLREFSVEETALYGFLTQVASMYRNVNYHNFAHAFDVTHFLYLLIRDVGEVAEFTMLDKFALMVAGVVHDVDHMGLNNSFHLKCDTPMGILSSKAGTTSVLEVHHCNLAIQVLSVPAFNIFQTLDPAEVKYVYNLLVTVVLATDMAHHVKLAEAFSDAVRNKVVPKDLLQKMLIKTADLSNTVKPFDLAHMWANCVTEEFFSQGDLEKEQGLEVIAMFDRAKSGELARGQIGFIDFVAKKHMELMATYHPKLQWLLDNILDNRKKWEACLLRQDSPT